METDKLVSWRVLPLIDHKLYVHSYKIIQFRYNLHIAKASQDKLYGENKRLKI